MFGIGRPKDAANETYAHTTPDVRERALLHVDTLYNFARYLAGTPADAEDLVQEAYARALGASESFVAGSNMKAWLFRILRNVHLDRRRRAHHDPLHLVAKSAQTNDDAGDNTWEPVDDHAIDALARIESSELYDAVRSLDEVYRTPLLLDLEGMTESEVAHVLECNVGTVKSRLSRARAQLQRMLVGDGDSKEAGDGR